MDNHFDNTVAAWTLPQTVLLKLSSNASTLRSAQLSPRISCSFADFDRRAAAGEPLSVVFLGGSLTWGARSSDPQQTSYRARISQKLASTYPEARFSFWDAAIGGSNSQLGLFRLERDVLRRKPDLVFVEYTVNDGIFSDEIETLKTYEATIRLLILEGCCVVQALLAVERSLIADDIAENKRRAPHLTIAEAYCTGVGDAILLMRDRYQAGAISLDTLWTPDDTTHPTDAGYVLYAEAVWNGYVAAVDSRKVCRLPEHALYDHIGLVPVRVRFSTNKYLPSAWAVMPPSTRSPYHDMLMSRWLDDVIYLDSDLMMTAGVSLSIRARITGSLVLLFGESTPSSGSFSVSIDGKEQEIIDAGSSGRAIGGVVHLYAIIATDLDPTVEHTFELTPLLNSNEQQELRLESLCVAGSSPSVTFF